MKTYRNLLIVAIILCFAFTVNAKESYYYYNGMKIPLVVSDDSVRAYTKNGDILTKRFENNLSKDTSFTSLEYFINGQENHSVQMSNRFYVQLFDSIADVQNLVYVAQNMHVDIIGQIPYMPDWYILEVRNSVINNSLEMSNYFYETGLFKNVDPGFVFHFTPSCVTDNNFASQWGLSSINACDAWNITKGKSNVKIAIIDSGTNRIHTEFPYNKFVDEYDCDTRSQSGYQAYTAHGTWVCGVTTSDHNHANIAGVSPNCKVIPISYSINNQSMVAENLAAGFGWAVNHGADVINCSWGDRLIYTWLHSSVLESAIQNALINGRNGKGCVVVFAAGNENSQQLDYPAYVFADILTVGAMKSTNTRWESSSWGVDLDIVAPGHNILTTDVFQDQPYTTVSGTSVAAPHVSGIAGLILSINPYLTQKEVSDIIESTAQKVGGYAYTDTIGRPNGTWHREMGYGLVDAKAAVKKARSLYIQGPDYVCDTAKYYLIHPSSAGLTVQWNVINELNANPLFSIVGPSNQDTVVITYTNLAGSRDVMDNRPISDDRSYVTVSLTQGYNLPVTYSRDLNYTYSIKPNISASNTAIIWRPTTQRTFTITNCPLVPDSALKWTVQRIVAHTFPNFTPVVQTNYFYGRTLTYTAPSSGQLTQRDSLFIYATNLAGDCGSIESDTLLFIITNQHHLLVSPGDIGLLNVMITEGMDGTQYVPAILNEGSEYVLELTNSIYGNKRTKQVQSANEQVNIEGLLPGVYVLLLKENGEVIAQEKVLIQ